MGAQFINVFDFKTIFISYFLGNQQYFYILLTLVVSFVCAKYQMPNKLYFLILIISSLIFAAFMGQAIYVLIIFIVGVVSFKGIARLLNY